ncbi:dual specificity protein phosphatase 1 [Pelomyxa schiedti]|nr:dual specificity protein phosphatase 1 [Pelomyxa schiedti]
MEGLYLGDQENAYNHEILEKYRITHVLSFTMDDKTHHESRFPKYIKCATIAVEDKRTANIAQYFPTALAFIDQGRAAGSVLVHCVWGMSRSAAVVVAYIMFRLRMKFTDALSHVRKARPIAAPNDGFLSQLDEFGRQLATVEMSVQFNTVWGEILHVVGSTEELGNWRPTEANRMTWFPGNVWKIDLPLYGKAFEYKYIVVRDEDGEDPAMRWEVCGNRLYDGSRRFVRDRWDFNPITLAGISGPSNFLLHHPTQPTTGSPSNNGLRT